MGSFGNSHRKWDSVAGYSPAAESVLTGGKCRCLPPDLCENSPERGSHEGGCTAQRVFCPPSGFHEETGHGVSSGVCVCVWRGVTQR